MIAAILVPELCVTVNGVVCGVNAPVYTPVPLTILKLEINQK